MGGFGVALMSIAKASALVFTSPELSHEQGGPIRGAYSVPDGKIRGTNEPRGGSVICKWTVRKAIFEKSGFQHWKSWLGQSLDTEADRCVVGL